ncbi:hypothetical protein [Jidongwangia harbinensis]|uniref:hypothetical protein n=1 Tax=Jidongwangia harbinensis TaxID=2878561 RepID=UPI001CD9967A|nr:hypothetical protein [Jidongwangia harbinensis]MCA2212708.1 hypothetical protein [Jidongwangia harbinensis]
MSRQVRHRVMALVLGGLLLGTPLLANGTASAEQVEGGRQVVFGGGGVLGLSCRSNPDTGALTVPAESTVRVVNRTGHSARLQLGGTPKGTLPDDGATEVRFRRGTTAVLLSPRCAFGDESTPVLVTATPSAPPTGMPNPIPTPDDSAAPSTPVGSGSPSVPVDDGSTLPDTVAPPTRPQRPGATRPGLPRPRPPHQRPRQSVTITVQAMPQGGSQPRVKARTSQGTVTAAPTFAGMPPGDHKTVVTGVPTLDVSSAAGPAPAAPTSPPPTVAVAEPVAAMEPMSKNGQIGLLALIAAVCVAGVSVGAIRAFVSQRASRATIA